MRKRYAKRLEELSSDGRCMTMRPKLWDNLAQLSNPYDALFLGLLKQAFKELVTLGHLFVLIKLEIYFNVGLVHGTYVESAVS